MRYLPRVAVIVFGIALAGGAPVAQAPTTAKAPVHAKQVKRLLIKNAMVLSGPAVPAAGPMDILVEDGLIARMGNSRNWPEADEIIDATGKYVMPGIVNTHMHWHEERVGPMPIQYQRNLYLAAGVTTAREVGGEFEKTKQWHAESAAHTIVAPRIVVYPMLANLEQGAKAGRHAGAVPRAGPRRQGARRRRHEDDRSDGQAISSGAMDEAKKVGLPTTVTSPSSETTAKRLHRHGVELHRALLRHRRRGARRHAGFSARDELLERDAPVRPRRRAVHPEEPESREAVTDARHDGREARRLEPDALDLRGEPRFHQARAEPAVVQGLPPPVAARSTSTPSIDAPRDSSSSAGRPRRKRTGSSNYADLDGDAARVRTQGRH